MSSRNQFQGNGTPSKPLVSAVQRILRPLVKLLLAKGMGYPYLSKLLKTVYVEVAEQEFPLEGKSQTHSRISLLSGVHRKDVKRIREASHDELSAPPVITLGAQLVALWTTDQRYINADGNPLCLPRLASDSDTDSFESLVQSVSKDIRPRAVLDEWIRLGVAYVNEDDYVCLQTDAFIPNQGFDEKAFYFGQNAGDHLAAATHNLLGQQPSMLERSVYYDSLTNDSIDELASLARKLGMQTLHTINKRAIELQERDKLKATATKRMNFGNYFFNESMHKANTKDESN